MWFDNVGMLEDTLKICEDGYFSKNGKRVDLKLTKEQMMESHVFLPEDIDKIRAEQSEGTGEKSSARCSFNVTEDDSYDLGIKLTDALKMDGSNAANRVLILNFANPVEPGGGVRRGARAQEEDLCRKSTLLLAVESEESLPYYEYNRSFKTLLGTDAIIIHPNVEIIKGSDGELLNETKLVAVMTCAAPMIIHGVEDLTREQYFDLLFRRIDGMLRVAKKCGYKALVFGAWGCGAFCNDAKEVAEQFYKAIKAFSCNGMDIHECFDNISFGILTGHNTYNFDKFNEYFSREAFYAEEAAAEKQYVIDTLKASEENYDKIRGCIWGGAIGDALGYPIEFWDEDRIRSNCGPDGPAQYIIMADERRARVSDDTQMTLFTATGILAWDTKDKLSGIKTYPREMVALSYQAWFATQHSSFDDYQSNTKAENRHSWICDIPELFKRRAPGNTCLSALRSDAPRSVSQPINNSKGCGGVMRVAPMGLIKYGSDIKELDMEAAEIAAITHGHSLGYMPAAVLAHIINRIVFPENPDMTLKDIIIEANETVKQLFAGDSHIDELDEIINRAIKFSENNDPDIDNIHKLGEGWVAEETLAIAIYCSLKYQNDFSKAVTVSVSHKGDSDSTGAVTGNILGAFLGYNGISDDWKYDMEMWTVFDSISLDLCHRCLMIKDGFYKDEEWLARYVSMRKKADLVLK